MKKGSTRFLPSNFYITKLPNNGGWPGVAIYFSPFLLWHGWYLTNKDISTAASVQSYVSELVKRAISPIVVYNSLRAFIITTYTCYSLNVSLSYFAYYMHESLHDCIHE